MSTWVQKVQENVRKVISRKRNPEKVKFGVPFEDVCNNDIPNSLIMCFLKLIEDGPYKREIFRAPGSCGNVRTLLHLLHNGKPVDWGQTSTHAVASVIKIFLQKLPEGFFGHENETALIGLTDEIEKNPEECCLRIGEIISSLPVCRQTFLALFLGTLKWISIVRGHIHYWQNVKQSQHKRPSPPTLAEQKDASISGDISTAVAIDLEKCVRLCANSLGLSVAPSLLGRSLVARKRRPDLGDLQKFKHTSDVLTFMIGIFGDHRLFPASSYEYLACLIKPPDLPALSGGEMGMRKEHRNSPTTLNALHGLRFEPGMSRDGELPDWSFSYDIKRPVQSISGQVSATPPSCLAQLNVPCTARKSKMSSAMSNLTSKRGTVTSRSPGLGNSSPSSHPFASFGGNRSSCSEENLDPPDHSITMGIESEYFYDELLFEEPTSSCYFDYPSVKTSHSPSEQKVVSSIVSNLLPTNLAKFDSPAAITRSLQNIASSTNQQGRPEPVPQHPLLPVDDGTLSERGKKLPPYLKSASTPMAGLWADTLPRPQKNSHALFAPHLIGRSAPLDRGAPIGTALLAAMVAERRVSNMRARSEWFLGGANPISPRLVASPLKTTATHLSVARCRGPARSVSPSTSFPLSSVSSSSPSSSSFCCPSRSPSPTPAAFEGVKCGPALFGFCPPPPGYGAPLQIRRDVITCIPKVVIKKPSVTRRYPYQPPCNLKMTQSDGANPEPEESEQNLKFVLKKTPIRTGSAPDRCYRFDKYHRTKLLRRSCSDTNGGSKRGSGGSAGTRGGAGPRPLAATPSSHVMSSSSEGYGTGGGNALLRTSPYTGAEEFANKCPQRQDTIIKRKPSKKLRDAPLKTGVSGRVDAKSVPRNDNCLDDESA